MKITFNISIFKSKIENLRRSLLASRDEKDDFKFSFSNRPRVNNSSVLHGRGLYFFVASFTISYQQLVRSATAAWIILPEGQNEPCAAPPNTRVPIVHALSHKQLGHCMRLYKETPFFNHERNETQPLISPFYNPVLIWWIIANPIVKRNKF